jgi:hypothetical protein
VIIERSLLPNFLTNTFLAGTPGGEGFFVDAGGPMEPLFEKAAEHAITPTHVLLTHHHYDHVAELPAVLERYPGIAVLAHPEERDGVAGVTGRPRLRRRGDGRRPGGHRARLPRPHEGDAELPRRGARVHGRHAVQELGGRRARAGLDDLRGPQALGDGGADGAAPGDQVLPGPHGLHHDREEWETNRFVRVWRGLDPEGDRPCTALGEPATLVLLGDDYDGGHKAWVRWPDGRDDIVPGSKVEVQ